MRNHLSFHSPRFTSAVDEANLDDFGNDFAVWLLAQLRALPGNPPFIFSDLIEEDYGWGFWVGRDFWVAIGLLENSPEEPNPEWLLTVAYEPGLNLFKRLLGKPDRAMQLQICQLIHAALAAAPEITDVRWCSDGERDCGDEPA